MGVVLSIWIPLHKQTPIAKTEVGICLTSSMSNKLCTYLAIQDITVYKKEHIQNLMSPLEWLGFVVIPIFVNAKNVHKQSYIEGLSDS